jgi:hypothetical protein
MARSSLLIQHGKADPVRPVRCLPADFALPAYYNYCQSRVLRRLHSISLIGRHWDLAHISGMTTCPIYKSLARTGIRNDERNGSRFFDILGEGQRPDHTWLIGPTAERLGLHIDPNATHA